MEVAPSKLRSMMDRRARLPMNLDTIAEDDKEAAMESQSPRAPPCAMRAAAWRSSSTPLCTTAPTSWPSSPPWRSPSA
ncbi:unnamed protein product [Miscanthus lutarioriparius]|uniref:Uncharacterized protein n=1 Tax=Miscanthus lutarioriparius TaxID=422564 RepID=A0A811SIC5_9POAL|nr:unnamed protein product [Miscanthus lutarioriparius]